MFFGGSPFDHFAGMHGGEGGRRGPPADVDTTELYQILGIEKDCTENDIKKAYRKLALKVSIRLTAIVLLCNQNARSKSQVWSRVSRVGPGFPIQGDHVQSRIMSHDFEHDVKIGVVGDVCGGMNLAPSGVYKEQSAAFAS